LTSASFLYPQAFPRYNLSNTGEAHPVAGHAVVIAVKSYLMQRVLLRLLDLLLDDNDHLCDLGDPVAHRLNLKQCAVAWLKLKYEAALLS
jgi:hypothetical protein